MTIIGYYKEQWMVVVAEEDLVNHGRTQRATVVELE